MVERQFVQQVDAQRGQRIGPLRRQRQTKRRIVRTKHLARMRLEGQHRQRRVGPRRMGGADDAGVAPMHAVEIAQRDRGAAGVRRQVLPLVENPHHARVAARTQAAGLLTIVLLPCRSPAKWPASAADSNRVLSARGFAASTAPPWSDRGHPSSRRQWSGPRSRFTLIAAPPGCPLGWALGTARHRRSGRLLAVFREGCTQETEGMPETELEPPRTCWRNCRPG